MKTLSSLAAGVLGAAAFSAAALAQTPQGTDKSSATKIQEIAKFRLDAASAKRGEAQKQVPQATPRHPGPRRDLVRETARAYWRARYLGALRRHQRLQRERSKQGPKERAPRHRGSSRAGAAGESGVSNPSGSGRAR